MNGKIKLQADENGIYRVNEFEQGAEILDGIMFLGRILKKCKDKVLGCEVTMEMCGRIDEEYGIKGQV